MAYDKVIDSAALDANLTAVADAIRAKGGTSAALAFPDGFVDAVGAIEAGSGGGYSMDDILTHNYSGDIVSTIITHALHASAFQDSAITSFSAPNLLIGMGTGVFKNCKSLKSIDLPSYTGYSGSSMCQGCDALTHVNYPKGKLEQAAFMNCVSLEYIELPSVLGLYGTTFIGCTNLKTVILGNGKNAATINRSEIFKNCTSLNALVLKFTQVWTIGYTNIFDNTPFNGYNGVYSGHIYVPSDQIEAYRTATNWSTLYANYPKIFQPIEGSEYE